MDQYIYLKEGDVLQDGDEYGDGYFVIGSKHTLWPRAGTKVPKELMKYKPRRKITLNSKKFDNLLVKD